MTAEEILDQALTTKLLIDIKIIEQGNDFIIAELENYES